MTDIKSIIDAYYKREMLAPGQHCEIQIRIENYILGRTIEQLQEEIEKNGYGYILPENAFVYPIGHGAYSVIAPNTSPGSFGECCADEKSAIESANRAVETQTKQYILRLSKYKKPPSLYDVYNIDGNNIEYLALVASDNNVIQKIYPKMEIG